MTTRQDKRSDDSGSSAESTNTAATTVSPSSPRKDGRILPLLCPPTEKEATGYYRALPSSPLLIGRTSSGIVPWECHVLNPGDPFPLYQERILAPIGQHNIIHVWDDIEPRLISQINHLPWTSVDIWRIGNRDEEPQKRPVVVWVGICSGQVRSLPWNSVAQCLRKVRSVLDAEGLLDVECEMRASDVSLLAGHKSLPPMLVPRNQVTFYTTTKPFTTAIGQPIYPVERETLTGTLCIYLRPAHPTPGSTRLWALTCRHVALPNDIYTDNKHFDQAVTMQPKKNIATPRFEDVDMALRGLDNVVRTATRTLAMEGVSDEQKQAVRSQMAVAKTLQHTLRPFQDAAVRVVGHVFMSPPIGQGLGWHHPWTRDWALIELDSVRYPDTLVNEVDLRTNEDNFQDKLQQRLNPNARNTARFEFPEYGLLRLSGTIPVTEMNQPTMLDKSGEECILVGMHGAMTGLSWGCPSELKSTVRNCLPGGGSMWSREWAIKGSLDSNKRPFSQGGDSGAAVFDIQGRFGGMLTRGSGTDNVIDVSYVTPAELLLADIQRQLGMEVALL